MPTRWQKRAVESVMLVRRLYLRVSSTLANRLSLLPTNTTQQASCLYGGITQDGSTHQGQDVPKTRVLAAVYPFEEHHFGSDPLDAIGACPGQCGLEAGGLA
jgi:hypothetical protein